MSGGVVRRVGVRLALSLLGLLSSVQAAMAEQVVMPYQCRVERGRVVLTPGVSQSYQISGVRAAVPFSTCVSKSDGGCRSFDVHSFDVECGSDRVPWVDIAAVLSPHRLGRASVDQGRLTVRLERRIARPADCPSPSGAIGYLDRWLKAMARSDCNPQRTAYAFRPVTFPTGFAPVAEVGARLQTSGLATAAVPERGPAVHRIAGVGLPVSAAVAEAASAQQADAIPRVPDAAAANPSQLPATWLTVVERSERPVDGSSAHGAVEPAAAPFSDAVWRLAAGALLVLLVAAAAGMGVARLPSVRVRLMRLELVVRGWWRTGRAAVRRDESLPEARAAREIEDVAEQQLVRLDARAQALSQAQPLRRVLLRELHRHRRRLEAARAIVPEGAEGWQRHRNRVEVLLGDVVRLGDIVDGAERSLTVSSGPLPAPANTHEAYEVLGANPEVGERVLKKLVEALRACWHPDLARDEADRRQREDRIKQINVAWDLISRRRVEG